MSTTFTKPQDLYAFFFQDTLEDYEGEVYACLMLLDYMGGYFKKGRKNLGFGVLSKKQDLMTFSNLTPKGWVFTKTYLFLFLLFRNFEIQDTIEVVFHIDVYKKFHSDENEKQKGLIESLIKNNGKGLFSDLSYISLGDNIFEYIEIKNNFDSIENIENIRYFLGGHIDEFQTGIISKKYNLLPPEKQRNLMVNKLSDFYTLVGHTFTLRESQFKQYEGISFILVIALLWELEYINIWDFHSLDDTPVFDKNGNYLHEKEDTNFEIYITKKSSKLFEGLFEMKNMILDKIFDEEYKKISILRKGGKFHMIEGEKEINGNEALFVELQQKYPHSDIKARNYNGKTTKYEVKEKIKLNNIEQE